MTPPLFVNPAPLHLGTVISGPPGWQLRSWMHTLARVHELALMDSVVTAVCERVPASKVTCVRLEVGKLAGVIPEALRFCFEVCTQGTTLEGATLEIEVTPGRGRCRRCGDVLDMADLLAICACGSTDLELLSGGELRIKEVEVA